MIEHPPFAPGDAHCMNQKKLNEKLLRVINDQDAVIVELMSRLDRLDREGGAIRALGRRITSVDAQLRTDLAASLDGLAAACCERFEPRNNP